MKIGLPDNALSISKLRSVPQAEVERVWLPLIDDCKSCDRIGIVGVRGLGHLAIQFAARMGCDVVVFSSTDDKKAESLTLGARDFYVTKGVSDYSKPGVTKPIDRLIITSSAEFSLGIFYPVLSQNASIIPLSIDGGRPSCAVHTNARLWTQDYLKLHYPNPSILHDF